MGLDSKTNAVAHYAVSLAMYAAHHEAQIDYTQSAARWDGIDHSRDFPELPHHADCSAFVTWVAWAARRHVRGKAGIDVINNQRWLAGYTGTMIENGARHNSETSSRLYKPGRTAVFYADEGHEPTHTALYVGDVIWGGHHLRDQVVSHGSNSGPQLHSFNYRRVVQARAYPI